MGRLLQGKLDRSAFRPEELGVQPHPNQELPHPAPVPVEHFVAEMVAPLPGASAKKNAVREVDEHSASVSLAPSAQEILYPFKHSAVALTEVGENFPRQAQTPWVPNGNPSEQGGFDMSTPESLIAKSGIAVPSFTHQSFTQLCPSGQSSWATEQRHTRSAGCS